MARRRIGTFGLGGRPPELGAGEGQEDEAHPRQEQGEHHEPDREWPPAAVPPVPATP